MSRTKVLASRREKISVENISNRTGTKLSRVFTKASVHPFDEMKWVKRDAIIESGTKKVFEQRHVEFPAFWSGNAINITVSKYFRGKLGSPEREQSLREMIERVAKNIRKWGEKFGYFGSPSQAQIFEDELTHLLVHQKASFNSPVWFNVGTTETPQCSACFILAAEDNMKSILEWISNEGMIFKGGSGAGINLSRLRSKRESLSKGGKASGPVSFMRGADSVAGMIKSGGTTRRAAKMVVLDIDHPDILEFIRCKAEEEKKVHALRAGGFDMSDLNNDAWTSVQFQNANNSVRITDDFMKAVEADGEWQTTLRTTGEVADTLRARDLLLEIAEAAWECGDPGVQFDTTINDWHTCPASGRINASNPCAEYMHLDNSACNLASINLLKFLREDGTFAVREFKQAVDIFILAQDIIVEGSSYPTEKITENARNFRELGLGYANLGALLMTKGLPYDSEEGRAWAGAISSVLAGEAYRYSGEMARVKGTFAGFKVNRKPMLRVIAKHRRAAQAIKKEYLDDPDLASAAEAVWDEALAIGEEQGFRNSQVTVIAPTGTIALKMDCDTTGIEPDFSLVKMKQLVGGGWMTIVNQGVSRALRKLNYREHEVDSITTWIKETGTIEGAPGFKEEHLAIFDCAVKPGKGTRAIHWQGHVKLVAAVQPFISGAISKTFNMSSEVTKEEIADAYTMAWKLGIKAFAVYRDGSKASQPLQTAGSGTKEKVVGAGISRRKLPATRSSETHKFSIAGHEGYLTHSIFETGEPAEIFIRIAKQGSTLSGLLDSFAISVSMALQYGVPMKELCHKYIHSRFEPSGFTKNPDIQVATSILDYIFRYLGLRFLSDDELEEFGMARAHREGEVSGATEVKLVTAIPAPKRLGNFVTAETVCKHCGGMMVRTGNCTTCLQCGTSNGGCS